MSQNSFQKNPFVNSNNTSGLSNGKFTNYAQLGRQTVEEVKQGMMDVKYNDFKNKMERKTEVVQTQQPKMVPDFKNRVNNLRNINRG
ncbi:MAG: hypothetical protein E7165_01905 [Firmicutes bacterium]|nr:hypothetical protein [Bacillota bacterium]